MRRPKLSTVRCSRDARDQGHVVVDDEDGEALRGDAVEQVVQRLLLAGIEARGGFVEQQHRRVGGQRAGDLDQPLMAVAEARDRLVGAVAQADEIERGAGAAAQRAVARRRPARCRRARRRSRRSRARSSSGTGGCSGTCARARRLVRLCAGSAVTSTPSTKIAPARRAIEAGDDVERRRLAAAVRADQRMHLAAPHGEIDAVDRLQAAEIFGEALHFQRDVARRNRRARSASGSAGAASGAARWRASRNRRPTKPQMPSGMKMTIRMTASAVDREIEAGHALQEAQPFRE